MNNEFCPKVEKCPIFQDVEIEGYHLSDHLRKMYKLNFCKAGEKKFNTCKRYIAAEALQMPIPKIIMPNSTRTVEEIKELIEKVGR